MGNELINVPNWGFDAVKIFREPHSVMREFGRKHKISFYQLEYWFHRQHRQVLILYSGGCRIVDEIKHMAGMEEFARFIKEDYYYAEFKWRNRVRFVVPFPYFEVSRGIIDYMQFKGLLGVRDVGEFTIDFKEVLNHLKYMLSIEVKDSADFDKYMDYWIGRIMYDCKYNEEKIIGGDLNGRKPK